MKRILGVAAVLLVALWPGGGAAAPVDEVVPIVRRVNLRVPRTYTIRFSLFDAEALGTEVWYEELVGVRLTSRTIRHALGSVTPFASGVFGPVDFSEQYWVGLSRKRANGTYAPLGARMKLAPGPYAHWSSTSGGVGPGAITAGMIRAGAVTADKLGIPCADGEVLTYSAATGWGCTGRLTCSSSDFVNCYTAAPETLDVGLCREGRRWCVPSGSGFGDCVGEVTPGTEVCNHLDDDCDGAADEGAGSLVDVNHCGECYFACADLGWTAVQDYSCVNGQCQVAACVPGNFNANGVAADGCECVPATEVCDGVDNNCDGQVDEEFGECTANGWTSVAAYLCRGADGCGIASCDPGTVDLNEVPGDGCECVVAAEVCDGVDNDCNGVIDDGCTPPPGNTCADPLVLGPGGPYDIDFEDAWSFWAGGGCQGVGTAAGPDTVVAVTVPAGERLVATFASPGADAVIYLQEACAPASACLAGADEGATGAPETLAYTNASGSPRTYYLVLDHYYATATPTTGQLTLSVGPPPPPPAGNSCADPLALDPGGPYDLVFESATSTWNTPPDNCTGSPAGGPDLVLEVVIPDGQWLTATFGAPGEDTSLYLLDSCDAAAACIVGEDHGGAGTAETLRYLNDSGVEQTYYLVLDNYWPTATPSTEQLTFTVAPPPPGDTCADPLVLGPGVYDLGPLGAADDWTVPPDSCTGYASHGGDIVVEVTLADGETLDATFSSPGHDPSIYLLDSCTPAAACLVGADNNTSSTPEESLQYTNSSGGTETLYLVLDYFSSTVFPLEGQLTLAITP